MHVFALSLCFHIIVKTAMKHIYKKCSLSTAIGLQLKTALATTSVAVLTIVKLHNTFHCYCESSFSSLHTNPPSFIHLHMTSIAVSYPPFWTNVNNAMRCLNTRIELRLKIGRISAIVFSSTELLQ